MPRLQSSPELFPDSSGKLLILSEKQKTARNIVLIVVSSFVFLGVNLAVLRDYDITARHYNSDVP